MTPEILLVLAILVITIILFATEAFRVDVVAILIMVSLPWLGLITPAEAFSGLASNAVVAIIAVMILSYGVGRSGVMDRIARPIIRVAGRSEKRLIGLVAAGRFDLLVHAEYRRGRPLPASRDADLPEHAHP